MSTRRFDPIPEAWPAMKKLKERGIRFKLCAPNHIKVGELNFWPATGRIYADGAPRALRETGLEAFLNYIDKRQTKEKAATATPEERRAQFRIVDSLPSGCDD